jgi:hypothetical protein
MSIATASTQTPFMDDESGLMMPRRRGFFLVPMEKQGKTGQKDSGLKRRDD